MFLRNVLLALGALFVLAGVALVVVWSGQVRNAPAPVESRVESQTAVLVAKHGIPLGALLRREDIGWKDVGVGEVHPGNLLRGQVQEAEFIGAISRREFADGEPLIASDLLKPSDRRFLAAVLKPGARAVSISVDAPQSVAGLAQPDDHVDVILTQSFGDNVANPGRKTVGETVLRNARVIAIDQSLSPEAVSPASPTSGVRGAAAADSRIPKTVTLELLERQAEVLLVAAQLGRFQLAVRPLEGSGLANVQEEAAAPPVWASEVSPALDDLTPQRSAAGQRTAPSRGERAGPATMQRKCNGENDLSITGSTLECLIRRPVPLNLSRYVAPQAAPALMPRKAPRD